jgi:predicted esterase
VSTPELGYLHRFEPATVPSSPTLLLLHGTGGDENDLLPLGRMIAPGAALLSPRGDVLERGAPRFFRRLAEGVFDHADVARAAAALAAFAKGAAAKYGFTPGSLIATGFSNGANVAGATLLLEGPVFRGAILLRAQNVVDTAGLGARRSALGTTSIFLAGGLRDPIVPPAESEHLAELLRERGANVTLRWDEAGHTVTRADLDAAREWLAGLGARS